MIGPEYDEMHELAEKAGFRRTTKAVTTSLYDHTELAGHALAISSLVTAAWTHKVYAGPIGRVKGVTVGAGSGAQSLKEHMKRRPWQQN